MVDQTPSNPLSGLMGPLYTSTDTSMQLADVREGFNDKDSGAATDDAVNVTYDEIVNTSGTSQEELQMAAKLTALVPIVKAKRDRAKRARMAVTEPIWLDAYYSWRGEYSPEERKIINDAMSRNPYNSRIFIKVTKTKVMAAFGQLLDVVLANNKIPIEIQASAKPEGVVDEAFVAPAGVEDVLGNAYGYPGDNQTIQPGENSKTLLGGMYDKYKTFLAGKAVVPGPSPDPKQFIQLTPAEDCAHQMQKVIIDQMEQGEFQEEMRKALFETCLYGTGFMKGPVTHTMVIHNWDDDGNYTPIKTDIPKAKFVSCWNLYPDPDVANIDRCEYVIERHLLHRHEFRALRNQPGFYPPAIDRVLRKQPKYQREYWESIIQDAANYTLEEERYEVLEYWGYLDRELLYDLGDLIDKDDLAELIDMAHVNIWVCGDEVIRIVLNPYVPQRIPYYAVPYETHPHQIWGVGVAENMKDTQSLMNGHMRMGIDNLKLSGNVMLEVNEGTMVPGQEMTMYPGKIFRKQGGAPGQSIYPITVNNTTQQHLMMYDKARQLADEATGMPSYAQGQAGVTSQPRTASGTSMLLGQSGISVKTVVRNFDLYLLRPLGEAFFHWNMQFNKEHPEIKGDLKVISNGTSALMQKEVQSQRLLSMLQLTSNPLVAPFVNITYLIKQIAESLELDPDKTINNPQDAAMFAEIMGKLGAQAGGQQGGGAPSSATPGSGPNTSVGQPGGGAQSGPQTPAAPGTAGNSSNGGTGGQQSQ